MTVVERLPRTERGRAKESFGRGASDLIGAFDQWIVTIPEFATAASASWLNHNGQRAIVPTMGPKKNIYGIR